MNTSAHRLIWIKSSGSIMAVAESASNSGKSGKSASASAGRDHNVVSTATQPITNTGDGDGRMQALATAAIGLNGYSTYNSLTDKAATSTPTRRQVSA